jgi:D-glycero-D-manno-heptose 1,7-bisphosphate phosphatase
MKPRAVFVDRDGVLNDLVYDKVEGRVTSPFSSRELRVFPFVPPAVAELRKGLGYKVIVISNQPGVAKRQFTLAELSKMNQKIRQELKKGGTSLDGEYYCLHHPEALVKKYRVVCDCRKPKPGLLTRAARENGLDMAGSYFVGDSLVDVEAGKRAGCRTILVGHLTDLLQRQMEKAGVKPDYFVGSLKEVPDLIRSLGAQ